MGFFKRISDIIATNLDHLADEFEDPEMMLRQAIREMQESISEITQQTAMAAANEQTFQRELDRNRVQAEQWQRRAVTAVEAGDDALAKKSLTRKNEHICLVAALEDQLAAARQASTLRRRRLDAIKAKLAEGKRNLATLAARRRAAEFRKKSERRAAGATCDTDERTFAEFERLSAQGEQAEAEALAELRNCCVEATLPDEKPGEEDPVVAAELAELKQGNK